MKNLDLLFILIIGLIILYYVCNSTFSNKVGESNREDENFPGTENFDNTAPLAPDSSKLTDLEAIQNLGSIAKMLMNGPLTIPGTLNVTTKVQENSADLIPKGSIIMWNGATAPAGWALCDGTNGTPDLRGRFILGQGQGSGLTVRTFTNIGGAEQHTLTVDEMPAHTHVYAAHNDVTNNGCSSSNDVSCPDKNAWNPSFITEPTGGGKPHDIMPPFYVLAYIMKL